MVSDDAEYHGKKRCWMVSHIELWSVLVSDRTIVSIRKQYQGYNNIYQLQSSIIGDSNGFKLDGDL